MLLFDFPERDLLEHLIGNFFRQTNPYFPIFNEILFRRYVSEGLHLNDRGFGATVLLVAALGSRDSNDPRVYVDPGDTQSGGWKWFNQVQQLRKSIYAPATLFDLQAMLVWNGNMPVQPLLTCIIVDRTFPPRIFNSNCGMEHHWSDHSTGGRCRCPSTKDVWIQAHSAERAMETCILVRISMPLVRSKANALHIGSLSLWIGRFRSIWVGHVPYTTRSRLISHSVCI
jgi:hypothetical protein